MTWATKCGVIDSDLPGEAGIEVHRRRGEDEVQLWVTTDRLQKWEVLRLSRDDAADLKAALEIALS
jgi:hypothetical protein